MSSSPAMHWLFLLVPRRRDVTSFTGLRSRTSRPPILPPSSVSGTSFPAESSATLSKRCVVPLFERAWPCVFDYWASIFYHHYASNDYSNSHSIFVHSMESMWKSNRIGATAHMEAIKGRLWAMVQKDWMDYPGWWSWAKEALVRCLRVHLWCKEGARGTPSPYQRLEGYFSDQAASEPSGLGQRWLEEGAVGITKLGAAGL